jgi:Ca-activated chloride channel family protein
MTFGSVSYAYLLLLVIPLIIAYIIGYRKRKSALGALAQKELLAAIMPRHDGRKRLLKRVLLLTALIACVFALMRPQGGLQGERAKRHGLDIIVAVDISKSMLSRDAAPNRLERSKTAVRDFVKELKGDRIGLLAFSGSAFLVCPLTVDYNNFLSSLEGLSADSLPRGGTNIAGAIKESLKALSGGRKGAAALILITDGEDHAESVAEMIEAAQTGGIKIFCFGVGTPEGDLIPIAGQGGGGVFLKDKKGNIVKSRLQEDVLQRIALVAGGDYAGITASDTGVSRMYRERLSGMEGAEVAGNKRKRSREWFQVTLAIAIAFLIIEPLIGELKGPDE